MKPPETLGESLYLSYANLAMAHRALSAGETTWGRRMGADWIEAELRAEKERWTQR